MLYQLRTGKCIEISVEHFLRMSDEELEACVAHNMGEEVNDPFAISVLRYGSSTPLENLDDLNFSEEVLLEDELEDLTTIDPEEKFNETDYLDPDNLNT